MDSILASTSSINAEAMSKVKYIQSNAGMCVSLWGGQRDSQISPAAEINYNGEYSHVFITNHICFSNQYASIFTMGDIAYRRIIHPRDGRTISFNVAPSTWFSTVTTPLTPPGGNNTYFLLNITMTQNSISMSTSIARTSEGSTSYTYSNNLTVYFSIAII